MKIEFFCAGIPSPGGSKKVFPIRKNGIPTGKFVVTDAGGERTKNWRASVVQAAFNAMKLLNVPPLDGPVSLQLGFIMPRPKGHYRSSGELKPTAPHYHVNRPDAGKLARSTTDALTNMCFRDDAQICHETHAKRYGDIPGCSVIIKDMAEEESQSIHSRQDALGLTNPGE